MSKVNVPSQSILHRMMYIFVKGMSKLYQTSYMYPYPYYAYDYARHPVYWTAPYSNQLDSSHSSIPTDRLKRKDYGSQPFVVNIEKAVKQNRTFRTALWTGKHLQVTLMSIKPGEDIGLEIHPHLDQFLRIEQGQGIVQMGNTKENLYFRKRVYEDYAIMVPAGTWHNVTNTGNIPLKLYSIYAPPQHPFGTVHKTKADAMAAERNQFY
ncbi:mannose-6-phosphate isomerase-like protein (cupin superfamily) [Bacillus thermophilus]|uniref:Mannose-6-phosphate isomerase-like protein (Cupin superfamily) n=1 Tax=Siminovitchia thermophila TaxID=1245522 RepID=A0ABS2R4Z7_9BACI|nr:mannose-6-phosphate isomerase-like protein (cupin superfamily) [Siminovitchia thermophila]